MKFLRKICCFRGKHSKNKDGEGNSSKNKDDEHSKQTMTETESQTKIKIAVKSQKHVGITTVLDIIRIVMMFALGTTTIFGTQSIKEKFKIKMCFIFYEWIKRHYRKFFIVLLLAILVYIFFRYRSHTKYRTISVHGVPYHIKN